MMPVDLVAPKAEFIIKVTSAADLRDAIENTNYKSKDVSYNKLQHFDPEWAERVVRQLLVYSTRPDFFGLS